MSLFIYQSGPGIGLVLGRTLIYAEYEAGINLALRSVDIRLVLTQRTYQSGIGIRLVLPQLIPSWYVLSYPQYIPELILYPGCSLNTRLLFFIIYMHDMYPLICTPNIICIPIHITFFSLHFFSGCR